MFRISRYMNALANGHTVAPSPKPVMLGSGPVVIWNLIRRCNLACKHFNYAGRGNRNRDSDLYRQKTRKELQ